MSLEQIAARIATKIPKSMQVADAKKIIHKLLTNYESDDGGPIKWDEQLHKVGDGSYYHVMPEGAAFYESGHPGHSVQAHPFPPVSKTFFIDLDNEKHQTFLETLVPASGDIALDIESALPQIKAFGFDSLVIHGETGSDVEGPPVEFVLL